MIVQCKVVCLIDIVIEERRSGRNYIICVPCEVQTIFQAIQREQMVLLSLVLKLEKSVSTYKFYQPIPC